MANATVNPFLLQRAELRSHFYVTPGAFFDINLSVLAGVYAFSLACVVAATVVRVRKGTFWIVRLTRTSTGAFVTPHQLCGWLVFIGIFVILCEPYIIATKRYARPGEDLQGLMMWRSVVWVPLWIAGWIMAWTTALATLIPRQARPLSRWSPSRYPNLVNTFFLGLPLILMGICVPYAHYTGLYFDASFAIFRKLDSGLTLAAIAFEEGIQLRATVELPELLAELRVTSAEIVNWWRSMWIVWAAAVAVLLLVYLIAAFSHFRVLRRAIRQLQAQTELGTAGETQLRSLKWAYRTLAFTTSATILLAVAFLIYECILIVRTAEIASGSAIGTSIALAALWTSGILCTGTNVVVCARSFVQSSRPENTSNLTPVKVQKATVFPSVAASQGSRIGVWRAEVGMRQDAPFELDLVRDEVLHIQDRKHEW